ncbi:hypothetical protein H920_00464 [Fukomys damarensis]|uniref:Uncharacterized protein n=1 Tax=Fukomys damarensis TaxID=885580 RepID=A0A091E112_FUKDA|nr:hypothetical protein H920_00464 [Fukomys damarensis]
MDHLQTKCTRGSAMSTPDHKKLASNQLYPLLKLTPRKDPKAVLSSTMEGMECDIADTILVSHMAENKDSQQTKSLQLRGALAFNCFFFEGLKNTYWNHRSSHRFISPFTFQARERPSLKAIGFFPCPDGASSAWSDVMDHPVCPPLSITTIHLPSLLITAPQSKKRSQ